MLGFDPKLIFYALMAHGQAIENEKLLLYRVYLIKADVENVRCPERRPVPVRTRPLDKFSFLIEVWNLETTLWVQLKLSLDMIVIFLLVLNWIF